MSRGDAVLALLERAEVPPQPPFYGLLYDYVAGVQSLISGRVGEILADPQGNGERTTHRLYEEFVRPYANTEAIESAIETMVSRLATLDRTIVETGDASRAQSASLSEISTKLDSDGQAVGLLREWVAQLEVANNQMLAANQTLLLELDASTAELDRSRAELARLSQDSLTDPLTGIANRAGLDAALSTALSDANAGGTPCSLALLDVDRFKTINDTYGHPVGDQVLRLAGKVLLATVRSADVVGRLGGDEFIAIFHETNQDGALAAAENIRKALRDADVSKLLGPGILGGVTASIGLAQFEPGDSIMTIFARADRCLFEAKRRGRNRVVDERSLEPGADGDEPEAAVA